MKWLAAAAATVGLAAWLASRDAFAFSPLTAASAVDEAGQGASWWDDMAANLDPSTYAQPAVSGAVANGNVRAGLMMLRYAEGTAGPEGYRTMFGGGLFDSFADHPRIAHRFTNRAGRQLWTTAAGAYQFLAVSPLPDGRFTKVDTWDRLQAKLQLPDFSPASQDAAAVELIRERGALGDLMAGRLSEFVRKCAPIWASLPGAGYAQPERKFASLQAAFQSAGGITEA